MESISQNKAKSLKKWITVFSIIIPVAVAALFSVRIEGYDLGFLPPIYASINGLTAIILIAAYWAIRNKKISLHQNLIYLCLGLSGAFLLMYVAYHITSDPTPFGGTGNIKYVYYSILISHIALSVIIIPLVLFSVLRAWLGKWEQHRKLAKITLPIWLYVAVTGVVVYLMISPYYT